MRRLLSFVLAAVLCLGAVCGLAGSENETRQIIFSYRSNSNGISGDYKAVCFYTDDYFSGSSLQYDPSLATMSVCLSIAAFSSIEGGSYDYTQKYINAENLLKDIGIPEENIRHNNSFAEEPGPDTIGVIAGNRPVTLNGREYTLITAAVRGGFYDKEWAGNFRLGKDGPHEGFEKAKNDVLLFLKDYIAQQQITGPVKIWITGYSRGAAAANLTGAAIDEGALSDSSITFSPEDVYVYCFECPAGALKSSIADPSLYGNIFNIINPIDPVPYLAPAAMDFCRYGTDVLLPSPSSEPEDYTGLKNRMLAIYNSLESTSEYIVDDFKAKKIGIRNWLPGGEKISFVQDDDAYTGTQGAFLEKCVNDLSEDHIGSRENYTHVYQDVIQEFLLIYMECTGEQERQVRNSLIDQAASGWRELALSFLRDSYYRLTAKDEAEENTRALRVAANWLKNALTVAGITDFDEDLIDSAGIDLAFLLLDLAKSHPNEITTLIMNAKTIGFAHQHELCYAWLASMDPNYN